MKKLTYLLLMFNGCVSAQVIANLDTNNILIGDPITLTIQAEVKDSVVWPTFGDSIGNLELLSSSLIDSTATQNGWLLKQHFVMTQWDSGFYNIPSIKIGKEKTPSFTVTVNTITLEENAEPKDIKGPIEAPLSFAEILPYLLGAFILSLLIYLLIKYLKREKTAIVLPSKSKAIIPPFQIALNELENLKVQKKWQNGDVKAYYSDLSEIIRTYIENGLNTPAMEMLTEDILNRLKIQNIKTDQLRSLLSNSDMAKFAKAQPSNAENELAMDQAIEFIHQTKPIKNDD